MRSGHWLEFGALSSLVSALTLLVGRRKEYPAHKNNCAAVLQRLTSGAGGGRKLWYNRLSWVHLENVH